MYTVLTLYDAVTSGFGSNTLISLKFTGLSNLPYQHYQCDFKGLTFYYMDLLSIH